MKEKDMTTQTPASIRVTRYLASPALVLGLAIGSAAVANALPEWDIGAYDNCMRGLPTIMTPEEYEDAHYQCCIKSGGKYHHTYEKCQAPPAEQSGRNPLTSDAPTHIIQPSPLPGQGGDLGPAPGGVLTSSP
jgi:hypothetical protein